MIFVDTGAFFAAYVSSDVHHQRANLFWDEHVGEFVTTDYVLDELFTLLRRRQEHEVVQ